MNNKNNPQILFTSDELERIKHILNPENWDMFFAAERERHQWHIEAQDSPGMSVCGRGETASMSIHFGQLSTTPVCAECLAELYAEAMQSHEIVPATEAEVADYEREYQQAMGKMHPCPYCDRDVHEGDGYQHKGEWFCNKDHAYYWDYGTSDPTDEDLAGR